MSENRRGVLYPERLPEFHRVAPPPELAHAVQWLWIPEWDLPAGVTSRQEILPFPECNLVVESTGVTFVGPPTRRSERVLSGRGWAVGALLRPAAAPALLVDRAVASLRDTSTSVSDAALHQSVSDAMRGCSARHERAVTAVGAWIGARVAIPQPGSDAALANQLADALADPAITRVDELPGALHVSVRTLQRLADRFIGLSPHAMIRRRRLQEAAERLREDPATGLSGLASTLGYADHAHFTNDFTALLGLSPSAYRARAHPHD